MYSKVAIVGPQQWRDHLDISDTVDSTGAFGVVAVATTDVSSCSVFFFNLCDKATDKIGYKNFRPICSNCGRMPPRLFIVTQSKDCLFLSMK